MAIRGAARRLSGRAWGNALGGWKNQRRDARGRFSTGSGGRAARKASARRRVGNAGRSFNRKFRGPAPTSSGRALKTGLATTRLAHSASFNTRLKARTSHGSSLKLKSVPRYTDAGYARAVQRAGSFKYDPKKTTRSIQQAHMKNIAALKVGEYAGQAGALAIGGTTLGPFGAAIAGYAGGTVGRMAAERSLQRQGIYIGPKQFMALSAHDQAAIVKRNRRADTIDFLANLGFTGYSTHKAIQSVGGYGAMASRIRYRKAARYNASTRGLPRAGRGSKGSFAPRRAPRYGRNAGVYDITTGMSGFKVR